MDERAKRQISLNMKSLVKWAKAYEEGNALVDDGVYDAAVEILKGLEVSNPVEFKECLEQYPMFSDGSWKYTGSFYRG